MGAVGRRRCCTQRLTRRFGRVISPVHMIWSPFHAYPDSDSRRSCGRCGSRAGRGRRRARGRSRARACRRACRAQQGGIGAGQASWSAGEGLLQFASFVPHGSRCMKRRRAEHASMGGVVLYLWATAPPAQRRAASPKARVADRCSTRLCGHARIHHRSSPAALGSRLQR